MKPRPERNTFVEHYQPRRLLVGQWLDQCGIDKSEYGSTRSDAEG